MDISLEKFLDLPTTEVAALTRAAGPQVCVFPINNTRRWFALEHDAEIFDDPIRAYLDISGREHIRIYKLLFDHGLDTLINPVFGVELFRRGEDYMKKIAADGLERLVSHPDFVSFYDSYQVRVHFYGDYRKVLQGTSYAYLSDRFDKAARRTQHHNKYRLFFGVCGTDATEFVAEFSSQHFEKTGAVPSRDAIISAYYGEAVSPADLFISSDKFWVFDYPLLSSGEEDLYFMVAPSLYLTEKQLREILYDHIYARREDYPNYEGMSAEEFGKMRMFYEMNQGKTLGTGRIENNIWYPNP
ncbi:MAG: diterpene synthase [Anaerolineaceae bacterium]|nr:MAG: diterpene synthase [Anaerolineaceae bacterium]